MTTVTEADRRAFHDDGVVVLRGVLPDEWIERLRDGVEAAIAGPTMADLTAMAAALGTSAGGPGQFLGGVDHYRTLPVFAEFALSSPLPAVVAELLGSTRLWLYEDSVLVKEPGATQRTEWHQDLGYFHVEGTQLCTTWCPLDHVTRETGAVVYVRGSHRWDRVFRPNLFVSTMAIPGTEGDVVPDVDGGEYQLVSFETEPGDVVVHHARTVHGAGGNTSATMRRRAVSVRYCGDDAVVRTRPGAPLKDFQRDLPDGAPLDGVYPDALARH